ncbi:MAG: 6-phosphofructokinase [Gammaproteobacteria bacterium]
MTLKNIFYAQSGGATAVINATACGVIQTARRYAGKIGKVYAGKNGIVGALKGQLIDTSHESDEAIAALYHTPACAFGSCRHRLKSLEESREEYYRLIEVFKAHHIGYFLYNGGNDSQDTTHKIAQMSASLNYPLTCIGLPKTIDNDLPHTDTCPGFGSVAKYVATSIREASLDVASMSATSTKVFILEVMGRHAGWIAAASGLASQQAGDAPHIILFPEIPFEAGRFMAQVNATIQRHGFCAIVVSEGVKTPEGQFLSSADLSDAFGHSRLGGVAPVIAHLIKQEGGHKCHWAVANYLQRSARHIASQTDVEQAYALGQAAVERALIGSHGVMLTIERLQQSPYRWQVGEVPLSQVANAERSMPLDFIRPDGFHITAACRDYLLPLIQGESYPPYVDGLPAYARLKNQLVESVPCPS